MRAFLIVLVVLLGACASSPEKEQSKTQFNSPATVLFNIGANRMKAWREGQLEDNQIFVIANLFKKAYELRPDDLNIQYAYYEAEFTGALLVGDLLEEPSLMKLYATLHPLVQNELPAPATLGYIIESGNNPYNPDLETYLKRAIKQNPYNAQSWINIAEFYREMGNPWLAASAADIAHQINPKSADSYNEMGIALATVGENRTCLYEHKKLNQRAAKHFVKASALAPGDPDYLVNIGYQYMELGLLPLAWAQAQKAFELEKNARTVIAYSKLAILLNKYDLATKALADFSDNNLTAINNNEWARSEFHNLRLLLSLTSQEYDDTSRIDDISKIDNFKPFYSLHAPQIFHVSEGEHEALLGKLNMAKDVPEILYRYLMEKNASDENKLLSYASDSCARSDAHFAIATVARSRGDLPRAKKELQAVIQQKTFGHNTYIWAKVLLERDWWLTP